MKKTLAFAVSALLAIGMLTGCGSTAEEPTAAATTAAATAAAETTAAREEESAEEAESEEVASRALTPVDRHVPVRPGHG